jgi:hypothetical protein
MFAHAVLDELALLDESVVRDDPEDDDQQDDPADDEKGPAHGRSFLEGCGEA